MASQQISKPPSSSFATPDKYFSIRYVHLSDLGEVTRIQSTRLQDASFRDLAKAFLGY